MALLYPNCQGQTSAECKTPGNWAFVAAKRLVKNGMKFVVKILGTFELRFVWKEEQQNVTRNFHGILNLHGDFDV